METLKPVISENYIPLTDKEIDEFFNDLDRDNDGFVTFDELKKKLEEVHEQHMPKLEKHHILHPYRRDIEKSAGHGGDGLHNFLCKLMPGCQTKVDREEFTRHVRSWGVPSQKQSDSKETDAEDHHQEKQLPLRRRIRAYWAVHGANIVFSAFVIAIVLAIGLWQGGIYITNPQARAALGWGVIMAKLNAGAIYPIFVFMLLSMSRHLATFLRRSYYISKFINWDHSQRFHIIMSCAGLTFATLHAIGHLTGSFLFGSRPEQQPALAQYLGPGSTPKSYVNFVQTLPGWSGITALGLFWILSLLSMPFVRNRSYEIFQIGHLLMFPMIGLLCAHGTAAILQTPMFGYWIAFPFLLVLLERSWRFIRGFMRISAKGELLEGDAMVITCRHPRGNWRYSAGQYILLQVPAVSFFQWHPFTVSSCHGDELKVHIKIEGDWTQSLRDHLLRTTEIKVGVDGPFGAPAQRFYDYESDAIIIGGGIGITPFAAILNDLEEHIKEQRDPWEQRRRSRSVSRVRRSSVSLSRASTPAPTDSQTTSPTNNTTATSQLCTRRIDFHWTVREKNNLLWFSALLNRALESSARLVSEHKLQLNINTHITARRKQISNHVFRYILDGYRTDAAPYSALTGLRQRSSFGRPDFEKILDRHFDDLCARVEMLRKTGEYPGQDVSERKVGVFYCGTPVVGEILSDRCHELTARARHMGLKIRYDFLMEVFG